MGQRLAVRAKYNDVRAAIDYSCKLLSGSGEIEGEPIHTTDSAELTNKVLDLLDKYAVAPVILDMPESDHTAKIRYFPRFIGMYNNAKFGLATAKKE